MSAPDRLVMGRAAGWSVTVHDVRFPTSRTLIGSDAMNPAPDYSAAYVQLGAGDGDDGHALAFTIGRGNDLQAAAIRAVARTLDGLTLDEMVSDPLRASRTMRTDSQLRWLGPEKGVIQMAAGAVVNALWDLRARRAGQPLWRLLTTMSAEDLVAQLDFTYLTDALTPDEAVELLTGRSAGRAERQRDYLETGLPAYTTSPGWLGLPTDIMLGLAADAVRQGYRTIKLKVGRDRVEDVSRLAAVRDLVGPDVGVAVDANQCWDTATAIDWVARLAPYDPLWIEEPTSPDDIGAHARIREQIRPIPVATGEHLHNSVMTKQFLQSGAVDILQIDATRVAGVNENLANLLLAAKFGVAVSPHAGGVGLCEMVQHLAAFNHIALGGATPTYPIEFVDHLHEHFVTPARVVAGRYVATTDPGGGAELTVAAQQRFVFPDGPAWVGSKP